MPDEILADIALKESIEARRLAIAFLFEKPEPCAGDRDRLKHFNMAALEIVDNMLAEAEKERQCTTQAKTT